MQKPQFALAAAAIAVATPALAQSPVIVEGGVPTAIVSYADLDLTSAAGRLTLDRRANRAASDLCLDNRHMPLDEQIAQRQCFSVAMTKARIDIQQAVAHAGRQLAAEKTIRLAAR
jgi:UrcA family protein